MHRLYKYCTHIVDVVDDDDDDVGTHSGIRRDHVELAARGVVARSCGPRAAGECSRLDVSTSKQCSGP